MGVVHLALDRHGRAVAIKVLRQHIAHDPDARARLTPRGRHPGPDPQPAGRPDHRRRRRRRPPLHRHPLRARPLPRRPRGRARACCRRPSCTGSRPGWPRRSTPSTPPGSCTATSSPATSCSSTATRCSSTSASPTSPTTSGSRCTGLVMGTPGYLAPEVVGGDDVTAATDWWGWAATTAFAASGTPPFGTGADERRARPGQRRRPRPRGGRPAHRAAALRRPVARPRRAPAPRRGRRRARALRPRGAGHRGDPGAPGAPRDPAARRAADRGPPSCRCRSLRRRGRRRWRARGWRVPLRRGRPGVRRRGRRTPAPPTAASRPPTASMPSPAAAPVPAAAADGHDRPRRPVRPAGSRPDRWTDCRRRRRAAGATRAASAAVRPGTRSAASRARPCPSRSRTGMPPGSGTAPRATRGSGGRAARAPCSRSWPCSRPSRREAPVVAVLGLLAWVTLARTADRSVTSLVMRRHERGARGSDVAVAVATSPWHLVLGPGRGRRHARAAAASSASARCSRARSCSRPSPAGRAHRRHAAAGRRRRLRRAHRVVGSGRRQPAARQPQHRARAHAR